MKYEENIFIHVQVMGTIFTFSNANHKVDLQTKNDKIQQVLNIWFNHF